MCTRCVCTLYVHEKLNNYLDLFRPTPFRFTSPIVALILLLSAVYVIVALAHLPFVLPIIAHGKDRDLREIHFFHCDLTATTIKVGFNVPIAMVIFDPTRHYNKHVHPVILSFGTL